MTPTERARADLALRIATDPLMLLACDENLHPAFRSAISIPGSRRWREVMAEERDDELADLHRERNEAGEL